MGIEVDMTGDKLNSLPPPLTPPPPYENIFRTTTGAQQKLSISDEPKPAECTETVIRPYPYRLLIWTDRQTARTDGQSQKAFIV